LTGGHGFQPCHNKNSALSGTDEIRALPME
jgi:hypothetical protein